MVSKQQKLNGIINTQQIQKKNRKRRNKEQLEQVNSFQSNYINNYIKYKRKGQLKRLKLSG